MPYIKQEDRPQYEEIINDAVNKLLSLSDEDINNNIEKILPKKDENDVYGHFNYIVSSIIKRYVDKKGKRYFRLQNLVGTLECIKLEMYRMIVADYEEIARHKSGDI